MTFQRLLSPGSLKLISLWWKINKITLKDIGNTIFRTAWNHLPSNITLRLRRLKPSHSVPIIKTSNLILYKEIIAVCSEIHTKHRNTLCGLNVELLKVKPGSTCYLLLRMKWLDTNLSSGNMFSMYHWNGLQSSWFFTSCCSCKLQSETFSTILCRTFLSGDCLMTLYYINMLL